MINLQQVLRYRMHVQQLDREHGDVAGTAILDLGAQDTGPDGALWALAIRGVDTASLGGTGRGREGLVWFWTLRGAPHAYRRDDAAQVAAATAPRSEADASKRIFDAARPLKAAGIPVLDALDAVAAQMRAIVKAPMVKGEVSARLHEVMPEPYQRFCRSCDAVHLYEQPFRLSAVQAGLELEPDTSPPVLRPLPGFQAAASFADRLDPIRAYLRLCGPATVKQVAEYIDAPVREVKDHWPEDAVEVQVEGETRWILDADREALHGAEASGTRLLGPYDLFLQARDRSTLVADPARVKALWPVLGRPGAVLVDGEVAGLWRPRKTGKRFTVAVEPWRALSERERKAVVAEAERLAAFRGIALDGVAFA
ncbi:winged helix DNA-binding domain-containing protein [Glycomyces sp. TRM65418]|uniref:winged helix DNA-binding domain-containing protein n=1 Tax=Glycomyces sp. TRM65418 TaxID=2867006 RepID=UPI001CE60641|nr:winged helix DNA-binding domain-containing protein [Glycomyces sp. TRM65418]MCC3763063.1 winged helix DNA-binding domain-containing protein [Glycomyces sp. TRM65418]QZD57077.1 winged helix DNA-binding domain-containing protein [Glycomyces sp. TRM65418]